MALVCNIDSRGKRARLIAGIVLLAIAVAAGVWAWHVGSMLAGLVAGLIACCGSFAVFEARAGWCALRAMQFKTPI